MRILVLAHSYPRFPGDSCGPFVEDLNEAHAAAGHSVRALLPYDTAIARERRNRRVELVSYRYAPVASWHLLGYSRTLQADVRFRPFVWPLAPAMLVAGTFAAWREARRWRPDIIQANWLLPNGFMAAPAARRLRIPLFIAVHGSDVFVAESNPLFRAMARFALRTAAGITACSPELAERLIKLGADERRIHLLPNGADPSRFPAPVPAASPHPAWPAHAVGPRILALGRFVHKKGFEVLIEAMREIVRHHPETHCLIAGGGDLAQELQQQIDALGLGPHITLAGGIPHTGLPALLASCDIFVVPSVRDAAGNIDGLPVVVIEAMAAGRPIVASRIAGIPLAIVHDQSGLLVSPGDPGELAAAVADLIGDPQRRAGLGHAARQRMERDLTWQAIAAQHRTLYAAAASAATRP